MSYAELSTGIDLYYQRIGDGPPLLLIPSSSLGGAVWHPEPAGRLARDFTVITFDPRGIGRSVAPDEFLSLWQLAADAADLLRVLDEAPAHVLGHSVGGGVALALALTYPRLVRTLTLAASVAGALIRSGEAVAPVPTASALAALVERGLEAQARHQLFEGDTMFTDEFRVRRPEVVAEFWERTWPTHATLKWHLRHQLARMAFDVTHRLQEVKVPTLVLVGSADVGGERPKLPASRILAERIPGAELAVLEGLGHGMFWEDPEAVFSVLVPFLARHRR